MSEKEKKVKRTITAQNLKGKIQTIKVQISEQENMAKLLQAKLNETNNIVIVLRGKITAYAELFQELTGQPIGGQRRRPRLPTQAPRVPTQSKKKSSSKKKKVVKNKK